jgi:hypothetical protein
LAEGPSCRAELKHPELPVTVSVLKINHLYLPILAQEKPTGLLEGRKVLPAKILIFLVYEMAFLKPMSVKNAIYK